MDNSRARFKTTVGIWLVWTAIGTGTAGAAQLDAVWNGGTGDWNIAGNWNTALFPNNGADTYNVLIDDGNATASEVSLDFSTTVDNVDLDSDDVLWVNSSGSLIIVGGGVVNNAGTINLNSTGADAFIKPSGGLLTFTGGGTLNMSDSTDNWIYQQGGGSFVNVNNTIQGAGNLGWSGVSTAITNQGTVIANGTNELSCNPGASIFTNTGTLRADNGAVLTLSGNGGFDNAGGVIEALDASTVLISTTTVRGGTLQTSGSGAIQSDASTATLDGTADTITNTGLLQAPNNRRFRMKGTINNTGTIEIDSTGSGTYLYPYETVLTLTGGGTVTLSDSTNNWIYQQAGGSLVNVDNTIQGAGNLGWSGVSTAITNQGTVIADGTTVLSVHSGSQPFDNQGIMSATGSGGMTIGGNFTTSGTVAVASGSSISRTGDYTQTAGMTTVDGTLSATGDIDIQGGVLTGSGTVEDEVTSSGSVQPGTSAGILTIDADYIQTGAGELSVEIGGLNVGTQYDRLAVSGNAQLDGTLTIDFGGFEPDVGDSLVVMTYASRTGTFSAYDATCLPAGKFVQVSVLDTSVVVFISDAIVGDADCNCALTLEDADALLLALFDPAAYALAYPGCSADMNGDLSVNGLDVQPFVEAFIP